MPLGYAGLTWSSNLGKSGIGSSGLSGSPTFGLTDIQHDPMTVGIYQPQIWGGADQLVRRNLLLNTATLATQNVTTLGLSYTLYLKGTGSVTLSGAATGTLNGTGAGNRVSLQFTATAGTLTLTVSGSVTEGHLTRTATTDHSYQAVTDWTTEVYAYNAARQLPWLRRNYIQYSEKFDQSWYWNLNRVTILGGQSDAYGGTTASKLLETAVTNTFNISTSGTGYNPTPLVAGVPIFLQVQLKAGERTWCNISGQAGIGAVVLNLGTGSIHSTAAQWSETALVSLGMGWYEFTGYATPVSSSATAAWYVSLQSDASTENYTGDITKGIYINRFMVAKSRSAYQKITTTWPATYTALAQAAGYPISLYSDRAGTIAVDSPETVVGKMLDFSTKGNHLVAPTDAARPLLKQDGNGNYYLLRDGVDDSLNVTLPNYGSGCVTYQQDAATCNKATGVTLNGATSFSTPAVDYARVLLQGASNNDAKIQKYLKKLAGITA